MDDNTRWTIADRVALVSDLLGAVLILLICATPVILVVAAVVSYFN